jgi:adenylate cyclase
MRRAIDVLKATAGIRLPYYRALFAEACARAGRLAAGFEAVAEAFDDVRRTDERWWEAELHRTRGELLCLTPADTRLEAESCFRTAIDIARQQGARALELRAVASLARLQRGGEQEREARLLLGRVYRSFTEGFDTADLRDARALLDA